jgi:CDP-diglyceride synthetase
MVENPYEPSRVASSPPTALSSGSRKIRMSVFLANCFLLLLFPPICCPCGLGPIGFILQPYLLLLGVPTVLFGFLAPATVETYRATFLCVYIVNYVIVSYIVGEFAGRILGKKTVPRAVENDEPRQPAP